MIIAFDPGKNIGVALVNAVGELRYSTIITLTELERLEIPVGTTLLVGDGTGSRQVQAVLRARRLRFAVVDEKGTSLEARALYWQHHKPTGWQRFLPQGLRVITDVDGMAAYAIVLRWLEQHQA